MCVLPWGVLARDIGPRTNPGEVSAIYGAHLDEASTKHSKGSLTAARFLFYKHSRLVAVGISNWTHTEFARGLNSIKIPAGEAIYDRGRTETRAHHTALNGSSIVNCGVHQLCFKSRTTDGLYQQNHYSTSTATFPVDPLVC